MDEAEDDVLSHMAFPEEPWCQLHSTNLLQRLNGEIKQRTDVVATFPAVGPSRSNARWRGPPLPPDPSTGTRRGEP
jgi:hypothetical protein